MHLSEIKDAPQEGSAWLQHPGVPEHAERGRQGSWWVQRSQGLAWPLPSYLKPGNEIGAYQPGDYTPESWAKFVQSKDPAALVRYTTPRQDFAPSYQQITRTLSDGSTQQGRFNTRSGEPEWFGDVVPGGTKARTDAAGRAAGEATASAQIDLPRAEDSASQALGVIQDLKAHPGLKYITGAWSAAPIVPGTPQAGADALAKQIQGKAFLEAFSSLKGGGAITEIEGSKAEAAMARLQRAQSRREYIQALGELEGVLNLGVERARKKAGASGSTTRIRVDEQGNPL